MPPACYCLCRVRCCNFHACLLLPWSCLTHAFRYCLAHASLPAPTHALYNCNPVMKAGLARGGGGQGTCTVYCAMHTYCHTAYVFNTLLYCVCVLHVLMYCVFVYLCTAVLRMCTAACFRDIHHVLRALPMLSARDAFSQAFLTRMPQPGLPYAHASARPRMCSFFLVLQP